MTQQSMLKITRQSDGTYRIPTVVRVSEEIGLPAAGEPIRLYVTVDTGDELEVPVAQSAITALRSVVVAAAQDVQEQRHHRS
jgi:hypothetical protein